MISIDIHRFGTPYRSLETAAVTDARSGTPLASVSIANPGLVSRDLLEANSRASAFRQMSIMEVLRCMESAAEVFLSESLPVNDAQEQSPEAYISALSASCGLPQSLCRANMEKLAHVLRTMPAILAGLSRNVDLEIIDRGIGLSDGVCLSFIPAAPVLGAVLPNNSPAVNGLWLPALALKYPVALKPGAQDPWTPLRLMQSLIHAGIPDDAFGYYPSSHEGAQRIIEHAGRSILFGDESTVERYAGNTHVSVHGPGWSKVILAPDALDALDDYIDVIVDSIVMNGGRSCVNASTLVVPAKGEVVADKVARRLAEITAEPLDAPDARLAAFINPKLAESINCRIDEALHVEGAADLTAAYRNSPRLISCEGLAYLLPTLIYCARPDHPLAHTEFMFPYASVIEVPTESIFDSLGPTLAATILTQDEDIKKQALACRNIARINFGPIPTAIVDWTQPHEGNLFDFLYTRRAVQGHPS